VEPQGVIVGGWSYVLTTYALAAILLSAYTASLFLRLRRQPPRAAPDSSDGNSDGD
jgi:hypothetical protein